MLTIVQSYPCSDNGSTRRLQLCADGALSERAIGSTNGPSRGARASQRFRDGVDADICISKEAQAADVFIGQSIANGFFWQSFAIKPQPKGYPSIRRGQPPHGKFDLTVGELPPIFDDGRIATGRTFVEKLPGLNPSLLHGQSEILT